MAWEYKTKLGRIFTFNFAKLMLEYSQIQQQQQQQQQQ